ncbi:MAG: hypothetical protein ACRDSG_05895 [Pseudonocardiaceae bacterium]
MSEVRGDHVVDVIVVGAGPIGLWLAAELPRTVGAGSRPDVPEWR